MLKWYSFFFVLLSAQEKCFASTEFIKGSEIGWLYYLKVLIYLGLVLGILYFIYYVLKFNLPQQNKIGMLKIINKTYLEQGVSLYIIKVLDNNWLIGVGNKEIKLIEKLGKIDYSTGECITDNVCSNKNIISNLKNNLTGAFEKLLKKKQ